MLYFYTISKFPTFQYNEVWFLNMQKSESTVKLIINIFEIKWSMEGSIRRMLDNTIMW